MTSHTLLYLACEWVVNRSRQLKELTTKAWTINGWIVHKGWTPMKKLWTWVRQSWWAVKANSLRNFSCGHEVVSGVEPKTSFKFVPIPRPHPLAATYVHPCPPIAWHVRTHAHPCYSYCTHVILKIVTLPIILHHAHPWIIILHPCAPKTHGHGQPM